MTATVSAKTIIDKAFSRLFFELTFADIEVCNHTADLLAELEGTMLELSESTSTTEMELFLEDSHEEGFQEGVQIAQQDAFDDGFQEGYDQAIADYDGGEVI